MPPHVPSAEIADNATLSIASSFTPVDEVVGLYNLLELEIQTDRSVDNPFDPSQIDLRAHFISPSNQQITIPAFWYQQFDPQTLQEVGEPRWIARFTPTEVGSWRAYLTVDDDLRSAEIAFDVTLSDAKGFVRLDPRNPRYFAYDDGTPYFAIGLNLGWSTGNVLDDYEQWLDKLSQNGGNVARIWMASWSFGIEWNDTGLGDYSARMKQAWLLDQVFQMAEERGITIMLTLLNHGAFSTSVNPEWNDNPYNVTNGGPLTSPGQFTSNIEAKELFKRRMRYTAARWGYSTSLFAWEWWNEVNWTPILDRDLDPWIAEMAHDLQVYDPYDHLMTTSYADGTRSELWSIAELDFAQHHDYTGRNPLEVFPRSYDLIAKRAGAKPIVFGELGFSTGDDANTASLDAIHLHNGIWAGPFTGYASTGMYWWWDTFIDPAEQWGQFRGIATFLEGEDIALMSVERATSSSDEVDALMLQTRERALLWIRSTAYDVEVARDAYDDAVINAIKTKTKLTEWIYEPPMISGASVTIQGLDDGTYSLLWFEPTTAKWLASSTIDVVNQEALLLLPPFSSDIAVKLTVRTE